jgi:predicted nucleic acid-binding protein
LNDRVVVDASVVLKWFRPEERLSRGAHQVLNDHSYNRIEVWAPSFLVLEMLNVAARRWNWQEAALISLLEDLTKVSLTLSDPEPFAVAKWAAMGLSAYDSTYVALAETSGMSLITDDDGIIAIAKEVVVPLASYVGPGLLSP